jgi:hypothetical protein
VTGVATDADGIGFGKAIGVFALYILSNILLTVLFSVLWVLEYEVNSSFLHFVNHVLSPWVWLASYFAVNFFFLRRAFSAMQAFVTSIVFALLLSLFLFVVVFVVLMPLFDPWF